jgi:uncharacterized membrane protein
MGNLFVVYGALCLGLLAGAVMGWVAIFRLASLSDRLAKLERQVQLLAASTTGKTSTSPTPPPPQRAQATSAIAATDSKPDAVTDRTVIAQPSVTQARPVPPSAEHWLSKSIKTHWMIWLGGICIGLAGIFLAKHSIEQGLLGPAARITLTIVTALALHGVAEYLRRRTGKSSDAFAALAGGASIMLYAGLLAGLHLYQLLNPGLVFAALVLVSLGTMLLALLQGPVLAAIGILGAFSVPVLVSTGSNNVLGALIYSFIISVSALLLVRYVFRPWLWLGTLAGALGWWLLALVSPQQLPLALAAYLTGLGYVAMAIHRWDWLLIKDAPVPAGQHLLALFRHPLAAQPGRVAILFALLTALYGVGIAVQTGGYQWLVTVPALPLLFFWVARHNPAYSVFPWLVFIGSLGGLLAQGLMIPGGAQYHPALPWLLVELSGLYLLLSLWLLRTGLYTGLWASLGFLSPVLLLALGYARIEALSTQWGWALATAVLGAGYMHLVFRQRQHSVTRNSAQTPALVVSLTLAAHLAFSLALVMLLREATLTLALAVQVISLTWLHRQFSFLALQTAAKVLLAIVLARLSLNPWLLTYPTDLHWSLWTYGGALVCCLIASRLALHNNFKQWLTAASIHLFVLLLTFEVRYWLYDGQVFASGYSFTEAAINTTVWGGLGLVYHWRARFSEHMNRLYRLFSNFLLLLSLANFGFVVVLDQNPLFANTAVSATPIFNILLLAYGLPVLLFAVAYRLLENPSRKVAGTLAGLALLLFCSLEIRHLWQGELSLNAATSDGELYTYSMVWLALAIAGSIWAIRFSHSNLYKGSMLLLIVVVAKIFLIDMEGLTGLLRAASFMGLGLSLLGLAYLHQRFREATANGGGTVRASSENL